MHCVLLDSAIICLCTMENDNLLEHLVLRKMVIRTQLLTSLITSFFIFFSAEYIMIHAIIVAVVVSAIMIATSVMIGMVRIGGVWR